MMRLGIVGYGDSGGSFASAVYVADGAEGVMVGGRNVEKAKTLAEKNGLEYGSLEDMLARDDIDCVAIATPPGLHAEHSIPFAEKGVHLMVEKPMCLTVADCRRIIDAAEANGVKLMVTQTQRYHALVRKVREILESGALGAPIHIEVRVLHDYFTRKRSGWQLDHALSGGGVTMNPFIHAIDLARYMSLSEVVAAWGSCGHHKKGYDIEGNVEAFVRMANGATAFVAVDGYGHRNCTESSMSLEHGALTIDHHDRRIDVWKGGEIVESHTIPTLLRKRDEVVAHGGYVAHIEEMRDAIEKDGPITSDGYSGMKNVEIAQAILRNEHPG